MRESLAGLRRVNRLQSLEVQTRADCGLVVDKSITISGG
jgi:hypothetical protein